MGTLFRDVSAFAALAALPLGMAFAQSAPAPQQSVQPTAVTPTPPAAVPAEPVPLPLPVWTVANAEELAAFIESIGSEGLTPADYSPEGLRAAIRSGSPDILSQAATERFKQVSSHLALGYVPRSARQQWLIPDPDLDGDRQDMLLRTALQQGRVGDALRGLLPVHPQYAALRNALASTPKSETAKINRIRLNMDRWRWLPRDLGERYIIVNVPAYTAALVQKGETVSRHRAVAGKVSTPTPQLSVMATGVILNPWWEIPKSLEGDIRGKPGYVAVRDSNGHVIRWRQPPGPANALGQLKFVMPNPEAIYLHDTNAKSRFNSQVRAFSAGCIRTQDVVELATKILTEGGTDWTRERIQSALAGGKPVQANFAEPIPVYIVYMSSAAHVDGRIIDYADIYKRDDRALAALARQPASQSQVTAR